MSAVIDRLVNSVAIYEKGAFRGYFGISGVSGCLPHESAFTGSRDQKPFSPCFWFAYQRGLTGNRVVTLRVQGPRLMVPVSVRRCRSEFLGETVAYGRFLPIRKEYHSLYRFHKRIRLKGTDSQLGAGQFSFF